MNRLRGIRASYRLRLSLGYAIVVILLAAAWSWSLYGPLTSEIVAQQRSHLTTIARAGSLVLEAPGVSPKTTARRLVSRTELRITIVGTDGRVLADTSEDPARMSNHGGRPEIRAALEGHTGYDSRTSATLGMRRMYVAVPGLLDGRRVAFRVSEPMSRIDELAANARSSGLTLLGVALVAAIGVGIVLTRRATAPVMRLKQAAEAMAAGDLRQPVPPTHGELAGLAEALGTLRDELRKRIGDLEAERETLRTVLDGLPSAVFLLDADRIDLANAAAGRMFRTPAGGWKGVPLPEAALPASLAAAIAASLATRTQTSSEVGPDPERRWNRIATIPLAPRHAVARTLVVITDVTDVRRLDQVRRDFVANASHELKTPAAAIKLLADAASAAAEDRDVERALAFAGEMRSEAERLTRLVVDLLDLSRLETPVSPETITDMRAAAANAVLAHRAAASAAGLVVAVDDSEVAGEDVYVAVDPTDVAVALDNLLANGIAYTEEGSVTIGIEADSTTVTTFVRDTGIGMEPDEVPRVFERFYRVDKARSRDRGGTGLGLSLVKHVAERNGGEVSISSRPGEGTSVTLRLPRAR